jgi:hypothetical protein
MLVVMTRLVEVLDRLRVGLPKWMLLKEQSFPTKAISYLAIPQN